MCRVSVLTAGRWRGGRGAAGEVARGSLLISHNPPLCFGATRKLSLVQIHTCPTFQDASSCCSSLPPSLPVGSLSPQKPDPTRVPVTICLLSFFLSLLCLFFQNKSLIERCSKRVCVWMVAFAPASRTSMTRGPLGPAVSTLRQHFTRTKATGPPQRVARTSLSR